MSIITDFYKRFTKFIQESKAEKLEKDKLLELINSYKTDLNLLNDFVISAFDKNSMVSFTKTYYENKKNNKYVLPKEEYKKVDGMLFTLQNKLSGEASRLEKVHAFGATKQTMTTFIRLLDSVQINLFKFNVDDNQINIQDFKVSTLMLLGLMKQVDIFIKCTTYLWEHFTDIVMEDYEPMLLYRAKYLTNNFDAYLDIINIFCNNKTLDILKDVDQMQKYGTDVLLISDNNQNLNNLPILSNKFAVSGLRGFNIVAGIKSYYDDWKHDKYLKQKNFKEWLETRSALLRMKLMNTDKDSSEYTNLLNILAVYDRKIADLDKKIEEYEGED